MDVVVPEEYRHLYVTDSERPILKIPEPVLRQVAAPIEKISKKTLLLADNMIQLMKVAYGVGLAAPQVGVLQRIVVISPDQKPIVLINPEIVHREGSQIGEEGCLSIPGLYGDVERYDYVEVDAIDRKGREVTFELEGFAARIAQHEIDHLDGILFIDKVIPASLYWQEPAKAEREA